MPSPTAQRCARDVTERIRAERALAEAEERFRTAFDEAPIGMGLVGLDGRWLDANGALCSITGYTREQLLSKGFGELTHPDDRAGEAEDARRLREGALASYRLEKRFVRADATLVWVSFSTSLVRIAGGEPLYLITQVEDISERKALEWKLEEQNQQLESLAHTDELTGLANRRTWEEALPREVAAARRRREPLAVAMVDLDRLKQINDTDGHEAGNEAIRDAARALTSSVRETDTVARYGGDEFGILLPDATLEQALLVTERLRLAMPAGRSLSVGVAVWDEVATPEELVKKADQALYAAKREGRNRVVSETHT